MSKATPATKASQEPGRQAAPCRRRRIAAVVSLYNYAIDEDDLPIERNPARKLTERTKGRSEDAPPTPEEFAALLDATAALGDYGPTVRALMEFAAFSLMRPGEIFALEWSDIDFRRMRIQKTRRVYRGEVDSPKSGAKEIALTPPARDAILKLDRSSPWVFQSKTGRQLSAPTFSNYWAVVKARAELEFDFYHATKHYGVLVHVDEVGAGAARYRGAGRVGYQGRGKALEGLRTRRGRRAR